MAFNYALDFTDPNASNDLQDSLLVQAMNDALNAWSTYISGTGTLIVQLRLAALGSPTTGSSYTIAQGGPTSATAGSYNSALGHCPATLSSVTELATGSAAKRTPWVAASARTQTAVSWKTAPPAGSAGSSLTNALIPIPPAKSALGQMLSTTTTPGN